MTLFGGTFGTTTSQPSVFGSTPAASTATTTATPSDPTVEPAPQDTINALQFSPACVPQVYLAAGGWDSNVLFFLSCFLSCFQLFFSCIVGKFNKMAQFPRHHKIMELQFSIYLGVMMVQNYLQGVVTTLRKCGTLVAILINRYGCICMFFFAFTLVFLDCST